MSILEGMTLVLFILIALIGAAIHLWRTRGDERAGGEVAGTYLRFWLGFAVGVAGIVAALFHVFDGQQIAREICYTRGDGGFQFENAMGDLAIGVAATLCLLIRDHRFWLAVIIIYTIQFWGDAVGHVYQMIENDNHCPDNTGPVLWIDIAAPFVAIGLYLLMRRGEKRSEPAHS